MFPRIAPIGLSRKTESKRPANVTRIKIGGACDPTYVGRKKRKRDSTAAVGSENRKFAKSNFIFSFFSGIMTIELRKSRQTLCSLTFLNRKG